MTTILTLADGARVRRCDATCHEAIGDDCSCICGGRYHGKRDGAGVAMVADIAAGEPPEGDPVAVQAPLAGMPPQGIRRPKQKPPKPPRKTSKPTQEGLPI